MIKLRYPKFWQSRGILSTLLSPASMLYRLAKYMRYFFANERRLASRVICVGNATVGGSGKTQIVKWLAKELRAKNIAYVIITKGYGSKLSRPVIVRQQHDFKEVGDESIMLKDYGTVIAARNILEANHLIKELNPQIIIVDDGLQNPNFYKDFSILVVDSDRGFGNGKLLPAGPLREYPEESYKNVNAAIVIGNSTTQSPIDELAVKHLFRADIVASTDIDKSQSFIAFAGIGNPGRFFSNLRSQVKLIKLYEFPDHHIYSTAELDKLAAEAKQLRAKLIATAKDCVKIPSKYGVICYEVDVVIDNKEKLLELIDEKINKVDQDIS